MTLRINNSRFIGNEYAISGPSTMDVISDGNLFVGNGKVFDFHEPNMLAGLGLPAETPSQYFKELLSDLEKARAQPIDSKIEVVKASKLQAWLAGAASVSTVTKNLVDILPKLLQMLG